MAFIIALTHADFPTLKTFLHGSAAKYVGRKELTPGTWERDRTKSGNSHCQARFPSHSYNALKSPFLSSPPPPLLPPESRLIFPHNRLHLVLTCKRITYKRFILDSRVFLGRFPIARLPFVSTNRQIASTSTRIHKQPLGFRQAPLRMCLKSSEPFLPSRLLAR